MLVTYLEMRSPPSGQAANMSVGTVLESSEAFEIVRKPAPTAEQYLQWYRKVGDEWNWGDRLRMDAAALTEYLADANVEVWVLTVEDREAGYCELDRRTSDVEIVYFGLFPEFIGQGLGKRFLDWTIRQAWTPRKPVEDTSAPMCPVARVWLHTCQGDHPAALPNYQRAGFEVYQVQDEE